MSETDVLDRDIINVVPEYGTWRVDGGGGVFGTKAKALHHAKEIARENAPCRVVVFGEDGTIEEEFNFE